MILDLDEGRDSAPRIPWISLSLVLGWFLVLCMAPDPRPFGAPIWAVGLARSVTGVSEPTARALATIVLRGAGIALLGVLFVLSFGSSRWRHFSPLALVLAPLLAVTTQWINYGYFPIRPQLLLGATSAILGALAGLALRRSRLAFTGLAILTVGLFAWGTATGIPDDLDAAARTTGRHLLQIVEEVPAGDAGFAMLLEAAFAFAEDNSHGTDPVLPNRAAILALGVILGDERIAAVAKRHVDTNRLAAAATLRKRVRLYGRGDLPRHFWVSAALTILSDKKRSITVGLAKEMMDAAPGGSGFSFVDLTANQAGNLFAAAATRDAESARAMQSRILGGVRIGDYCPDARDLPEKLGRDQFQKEFGGLGGDGTQKVVEEIRRRLASCAALR